MSCCGCDEYDWDGVRKMAEQYKAVLPSFGLHPLYIGRRSDAWLQKLRQSLTAIPSGVGEIGMDFDVTPRHDDEQETIFTAQLHLAREFNRPVTIHCRKAWGRLLAILKREGGVPSGGLIHSYSGSAELVHQFEDMNLHISFSGVITRSGNDRGHRSLRAVSRERLLFETDSPDLTPIGASERRNEPANLPIICRAASALLEQPMELIAEWTTANANKLFSLKMDIAGTNAGKTAKLITN